MIKMVVSRHPIPLSTHAQMKTSMGTVRRWVVSMGTSGKEKTIGLDNASSGVQLVHLGPLASRRRIRLK